MTEEMRSSRDASDEDVTPGSTGARFTPDQIRLYASGLAGPGLRSRMAADLIADPINGEAARGLCALGEARRKAIKGWGIRNGRDLAMTRAVDRPRPLWLRILVWLEMLSRRSAPFPIPHGVDLLRNGVTVVMFAMFAIVVTLLVSVWSLRDVRPNHNSPDRISMGPISPTGPVKVHFGTRGGFAEPHEAFDRFDENPGHFHPDRIIGDVKATFPPVDAFKLCRGLESVPGLTKIQLVQLIRRIYGVPSSGPLSTGLENRRDAPIVERLPGSLASAPP